MSWPRITGGVLLFLAGLGVFGTGLWNWFVIPDPTPATEVVAKGQVSTTESTTSGETSNETKSESGVGASPVSSLSGTETKTGTRKTTGSKTIKTENPTTTTTTKTTPDPTWRSEGITLALLGIGAGLMLLGAFNGQISELTFGGITAKFADQSDAITEALEKQATSIRGLAIKLGKLQVRVKELEDRNPD